ncbi:MAG: 50S ribosomal protein L30 [Bdellovibrionales bacterium]|nr:50S ribosomal protein L30 [Bdellovibrionales bacterium]
MAKKFKVTLKRSLSGCTKDQRETVRCLGLKKIGSENVLADNPANRGQIFKVQHLVQVAVEK